MDADYLRNGIGSQMVAPDSENSARLQNQYFALLCRQVGYDQCGSPLRDATLWTLVVNQGLNDVDRRCDAYLQWLDDKKRSRGPWLSQINALQSATTTIMSVIDPGSTAALTIVAQAFNLISKSVENYHSRLLLELESSTINSVVLKARHDFRKKTRKFVYDNRPAAEYAIRSYLRLCLPFAIETNINDYSTLGSLGIEVSEENSINQIPVIGRTLREDTPDTAFEPVRPTPAPGGQGNGNGSPGSTPFDTMARGKIEQKYSKVGVQDLQSRLCVVQSGQFDAATRGAISVVEAEISSEREGGIIDTGTEEDVIASARVGCEDLPTGAGNAYEKFHFQGNDNASPAKQIEGFQNALEFCVRLVEPGRPFRDKPDMSRIATGQLDKATRAVISYLASGFSDEESKAVAASGLLTPGVLTRLQNCTL